MTTLAILIVLLAVGMVALLIYGCWQANKSPKNSKLFDTDHV